MDTVKRVTSRGNAWVVRRNGEKDEKRDEKEDKFDDKSKLVKGNEEASSLKAPLGRLYIAVSHNTLVGTEEPLNTFYIDSGVSDYLVPPRGDLYAYKKLARLVGISAADGGKIYAYGSGTLRVATEANGLEREADLQHVYYAPGVHVRLVSLGEPGGQAWDGRLSDDGMELRNRDGDLFTNVGKVNNIYPVVLNMISLRAALAACTTYNDRNDSRRVS